MKQYYNNFRKIIFSLVIIVTLLLCGCKDIITDYSKSGFAFDTVIEITVYDNNKEHAESVLNSCMDLCNYYDSLFNINNPSSDIFKINESGGETVKVSKDTIDIIKRSVYYSEISGGIFDITIEPLYELWDFNNSSHENIPDNDSILKELENVNYKSIEISESDKTVTVPKGLKINLGAIAKGYIADKLKEFLKENDIECALINLGGNILTFGEKPDKKSFNIGIQKPFSNTGEIITTVEANNKSVVTSGIYQRYFEYDGKIYHHIINPFTGYPAENNLASVTIISDSSTDADALSTICMLLGEEKANDFLKTIGSVSAVLIDKGGNITRY